MCQVPGAGTWQLKIQVPGALCQVTWKVGKWDIPEKVYQKCLFQVASALQSKVMAQQVQLVTNSRSGFNWFNGLHWILKSSYEKNPNIWVFFQVWWDVVSQERPNMIIFEVIFADNDQNHCFLFARQSQRGQIWSDFIGSSPFLRLHSGSATPFTTP